MNEQAPFFASTMTVMGEEVPAKLNEAAEGNARASDAAYTPYTPATLTKDYSVALTPDDGLGTLAFKAEDVADQNQKFNEALSSAQELLQKYDNDFSLILQEKYTERVKALSDFVTTISQNVQTCINNFQTFSSTFLEKARAAEEAINTADTQGQAAAQDITKLAEDIIKGEGGWGNGAERKEKLTAAGYNYDEVQAEVNRQLGIN